MFVLSREGRPLMPCHPARARELLRRGRAAVARRVPFTIRLRDRKRADSEVAGVQLRIDPGSKGTGLALTDEKQEVDDKGGGVVVVRRGLFSVELRHRGDRISAAMRHRAGFRRRRRSARLRYRAPRSRNRVHPPEWLPPSMRHRVDTVRSLTDRLCRHAPVTEIHLERAAFDLRAPRSVTESRSVRVRLRSAWGDACAYCDAAEGPLNVEHVRPRSRGGSDRSANLVLACAPCNRAKGSRPVEEFLAHRPDRLARILRQAAAPLDDAAAMNAVSPRLVAALGGLGKPVRVWSGGLTHANRTAMALGKTHTLDALSVGPMGQDGTGRIVRFPGRALVADAVGRGVYARTTPDRYGFPRLRRPRAKRHHGFITGDLVRATVPGGRWAGTWTGRVSVRTRGQHSIATPAGRVDVPHRLVRLLQRGDGYMYTTRVETGAGKSRDKPVEP
ncbi:RNA-guided endonuclease IscB [Streptomyces sp. NPDC003717]|uniref:RNA-guided endonuclease IscB n=1 Tax=Streptomyces sp. NPDC003717 TaxID=3154276 RepID=UPI0033BD4136